jgi:DNA-binding beta-propeller fold protein YncE
MIGRSIVLAGVAFAALACAGGGYAANGSPTPSNGAKIYVASQSGASITVIDQSSMEVDTTVDLTSMGFSATSKPHHIAVESDGSAWYVSLIGDGRVLKFDRSNRLLGQVEMQTPGLMTIDRDHDMLYVGRSMTAVNPPKALGVIKRSTFTMDEEQEVLVPRPHAIGSSPDGAWVHSASLAENRIASVQTSTGRVTLSSISGTVRSLVQFAVSPDGKTMVVGGELSNTLLVFDLSEPPPLVVAREFSVGGKPWHPTFSPDGSKVYVPLLTDNVVIEVDPIAGTVLRRFTDGFAQPHGTAVSADGRYLFVSNRNTGGGNSPKPGMSGHDMHDMEGQDPNDGWLAVVDLRTGKTVKSIMLGASPAGVGVATR